MFTNAVLASGTLRLRYTDKQVYVAHCENNTKA
jgi:hypothetical protein